MKGYTLTRLRPNGTVTTHQADNLRHAGKMVAHCLDDNGYTRNRKEATQLAMQCEREGYLEHAGLWWRIDKA